MRPVDRISLRRYADLAGVKLEDAELPAYEQLVNDIVGLVNAFDDLPVPETAIDPIQRDPGRAPDEAEDPLGAVIRRISVCREGVRGPLSGRRIGLKDSIAVAGVPTTAASLALAGNVAAWDAVVVERLLAAGAEIVAKLNMDGFAWSGSANTGDYGPIRNPLDRTRSAGGSSGGSAAALYYDWIDMTLGTDQAGSNRMPASWCGVLGLKPTHGLVPYTGILRVDPTIDHVGPMTRTVADMAALMSVLAGPEEEDQEGRSGRAAAEFANVVEEAPSDLSGVRIGLLTEGFAHDAGVEQVTADAIRAVAVRLADLGAEIVTVSVPEHRTAAPIAFAFYCEGQLATLTAGGNGYGVEGRYLPELAEHLSEAMRQSGTFPSTLKTVLLAGAMLRERGRGSYYARAQNLRPWLRDGYDRGLQGLDALLLPTTPMPAFPLETDAGTDLVASTRRGWSMLANTPGTDISGHPALSIPAAQVGPLPLGAMLIGHHFADPNLLRIAATYEREVGWCPTVSG